MGQPPQCHTGLTAWTPIATPSTAPLANRTRLDCEEYEDNTAGAIPCNWLVSSVDTVDFASWNPSVDVYNCMLANSTRYCVLLGERYDISLLLDNQTVPYADVLSNTAVNSTTTCYSWYDTGNGTIDCSGLWLGYAYCVGVL